MIANVHYAVTILRNIHKNMNMFSYCARNLVFFVCMKVHFVIVYPEEAVIEHKGENIYISSVY
jgi:hypothetical protein